MPGDTFQPLGGNRVALVARSDRPDVACFADEVVIDFPSVAGALERIRRGFEVDEVGERWSTTVSLSSHDARRGATLPLDVPVRCTCRACGGRGESWTEVCRRCRGAGTEWRSHALRVRVPAGVVDGDRFHFTLTPGQNHPTRVELRVLVG